MSTKVDPKDSSAFIYSEQAGPVNLTTTEKTGRVLADGVLMGLGVLLVSTVVRKVDKKFVPESSKVSGGKIVGGCAVASVLVQLLKSYNVIPSTYGHVEYRLNIF